MNRFTAILVFLIAAAANAQPAEIGNFSAVNVVNDADVSLNQFIGEKGIVIIFRGNECPFDGYYNQRIAELVSEFKERIPFLLVNPYLEPGDAPEKMKMYATVWGLGIPYLADKDQVIMGALGAKKTPEAFVLKSNGERFVLVYAGAIDDNPQLPAGVKQKYLQSAIQALLEDRIDAVRTVRATGCTIRTH